MGLIVNNNLPQSKIFEIKTKYPIRFTKILEPDEIKKFNENPRLWIIENITSEEIAEIIMQNDEAISISEY